MKKFLVIGNPIEHSLSPKLHNYWIKNNNINAIYEKQKLNKDQLEEFISQVKDNKINGINVTVPFKKMVIPYLDELSTEAQSTQSVNTIYKKHNLISSVCISMNGSMIWNYTDKAELTMKNFSEEDLQNYLSKISDEALYAYNVYQIQGEGRNLFYNIIGDENSVMGLPVSKIKEYLKNYQ